MLSDFKKRKSPGSDGFTAKFFKTSKGLQPIPLKHFRKRRSAPWLLLRSQCHANTKTRKDTTKNENYRPLSLVKIDIKILSKTLQTKYITHTKKIIYHDQVDVIPKMSEWLNIHSISQ